MARRACSLHVVTSKRATLEPPAARTADLRGEPARDHRVCRQQSEVLGMRKVVAYVLLSLDGVAEAPDEFFADYWDDAIDAKLGELIATQDDVILGRRSYDEWAAFWPGSDI